MEIDSVQAAIEKRRKKFKNLREMALSIGVSHQTLYNALKGTGQPSYKLLKALGLLKKSAA